MQPAPETTPANDNPQINTLLQVLNQAIRRRRVFVSLPCHPDEDGRTTTRADLLVRIGDDCLVRTADGTAFWTRASAIVWPRRHRTAAVQ